MMILIFNKVEIEANGQCEHFSLYLCQICKKVEILLASILMLRRQIQRVQIGKEESQNLNIQKIVLFLPQKACN